MNKKWKVAQHLSKLSVLQVDEHAKQVKTMMTGNPTFTSLATAVTTLSTHITVLDTALTSAGGGKTKTDAIKVAKDTVIRDLDSLGNSVEIIANASPDTGDVIIHSAGMEFRNSALPKPRVFEVKTGKHANEIDAKTKGAQRAIYEWRYKKDSDATYTIAGKTLQAKYTFKELISGTKYNFCVETTLKDGTGDVSNVLDLIVV